MPIRLLTATTLALALSVAPASAATLAPLNACYVSTGVTSEERENVVVRGDAFAPRATVEVFIDGVYEASAPTGTVGEFELAVDAPHQPAGERVFTITATDGVNTVTVQSRVTNLAVFVRPKRSAPSRRVRFRGRGFLRDAPVYAHYLYGGKEQRTVRFARHSTAPCGTFDVKRRQIPVENPRTGRWIVQFDQNKEYASAPDPVWVRLPIRVSEVFLETS
jgi:hypothetical protein